ncbi:MAG: S-layer homology domain-containing protein [Acidimicrobiia bacterium]
MLGLVVALLLSIMPVAGAQVADDSGESVDLQAFIDTAGSVFEGAIDELAARGITRGCNPPANTRYCPDDPVTRGQMAIFIVRGFDLPATSTDFFFDDNGKVYEDAVNRLAAAGLTQGCGTGRYCGDETISRGEMAAFLSRARNLPDSSTDHFVDDNTSIFEPGINKVADAGITFGCNPPANTNFCPNDNVTRGQMAAFIIRALGGGVTPPPSGALCDRVTTVVKGDCQALMALYNSTGGPNWTNNTGWGVNTNPCTWFGVGCLGNRVSSIVLEQNPNDPGNNLTGSLPAALGNLTGLRTLDLASGELTGPIPTTIGRLKQLTALDLSGNFLNGDIPANIGGLTSLTVELDLHSNQLSGPLPPQLTNLNGVRILDLGSNSLSGPLQVLGEMPSLRQIDLRQNAFGGGVPGVIGNLQFLERLDLSGNNFSGIQAGLGQAEALNDIDLSENNLGGFSNEFTSLQFLTELDLSFNQMNGMIPDGIVNLPLQALDISNNSLDDPAIPDFRQLGTHAFVEELLLNNNQCLGTTVLAIYNYVIAEDPAWENCGNPPPPPAP